MIFPLFNIYSLSLITLPLFLPSLSNCSVLLLDFPLSQVVQWWFDHKWVVGFGFGFMCCGLLVAHGYCSGDSMGLAVGDKILLI